MDTPLTSTDYFCEHPIILKLCLEPSYHSGIILTKLVTYYSEDYAGIIGAGLLFILANSMAQSLA